MKTVDQIEHGIDKFKLFLRIAIAESEGEPCCSPEAGNDPENYVCKKVRAAPYLYQRCVEFAESNDGELSGQVVSTLLNLLGENIQAENCVDMNEVIEFAESRGLTAVRAASDDEGDTVTIIFQVNGKLHQ